MNNNFLQTVVDEIKSGKTVRQISKEQGVSVDLVCTALVQIKRLSMFDDLLNDTNENEILNLPGTYAHDISTASGMSATKNKFKANKVPKTDTENTINLICGMQDENSVQCASCPLYVPKNKRKNSGDKKDRTQAKREL